MSKAQFYHSWYGTPLAHIFIYMHQHSCFNYAISIYFMNILYKLFNNTMFLSLVLAFDDRVEKHSALSPKKMQDVLMGLLLCKMSDAFLLDASRGELSKDYCKWYSANNKFSIGCTDGVITDISCDRIDAASFLIEYLPSTIKTLLIRSCYQTYAVDTTRLPRNTISIDLSINRIFGRVNISQLPQKLQNLNLSYNHIKGPIHLTALPAEMHTLEMSYNLIHVPIIYYDNLPQGINHIGMIGMKEIGAIQPLHKSQSSLVSKKIFAVDAQTKVY